MNLRFTKENITNHFIRLEKQLLSPKKRMNIELTRNWTKKFSINSGVYVIYENECICYVGETGSIRERMADLLDTRNHVIRRNVGNIIFKKHDKFEKASASKKFHSDIETLLNDWILENLRISTLEIKLGRKEFEEYLCEKHKPKFNIKGKRQGKMTHLEKMVEVLKKVRL
jgi:hypothetical protein